MSFAHRANAALVFDVGRINRMLGRDTSLISMPITYTLDSEKSLIFEVWTGDVTGDDLGRYWKKYLEDPHVLSIRRTLVDLRQSRILFNGYELSDLIETVVLPVLAGRDWKTALVVEGPAQFGVSRQYHAFADSFSRDSIFHDYDSALAWLIEQKLST